MAPFYVLEEEQLQAPDNNVIYQDSNFFEEHTQRLSTWHTSRPTSQTVELPQTDSSFMMVPRPAILSFLLLSVV